MPSMGLLEGVFEFVTSGTVFGIPTFVVMFFPLIVGLIVGFLARKFLKIAIIAAVVILIATYLGFFGLNFTTLKSLVEEYGPIAVQYGTLIMGILPLGIGFFVGIIIGFLVAK
jgi:uncharacterized membrane protein (Fun14 family)